MRRLFLETKLEMSLLTFLVVLAIPLAGIVAEGLLAYYQMQSLKAETAQALANIARIAQ